jgi:DNA processing protein
VAGPLTEREAWALLLSVEGLGPAAFGALLGAYGGGLAILAASTRRGAGRAFAAIAAAAQGRTMADDELGRRIVALALDPGLPLDVLRRSGVAIITLDDEAYPGRLRAIELPPPALLVRGDPAALAADRSFAIVGTRRPSERGRLVAARIASAISRAGGVVVSGLAVGIDGAAHAAVTAEGRPTVAVLGSGHDRLFPSAHRRLATDIVATGGVLVSELFPDRPASKNTFPQRNRLISGLAEATIVVEAGLRSGALITADRALGQGRDCYVVPGPIDDPRAAGCLAWLHQFPDVVRVVIGVPELLVDLGLDHDAAPAAADRPSRPSVEAQLIELGPTAGEVARALIAGHGSIDELVTATGHEPATILGAITLLEMKGLATSTYGRYRATGRLASATPGLVVTSRAIRASRERLRTVPIGPSRGPPGLPVSATAC